MTSGSDFYHDELEPEQIEALLKDASITPNEVVEGLWHGQVLVRQNAARGARYVTELPDPGDVMLRIASKDVDPSVRSAIVTAVSQGLAGHPVALPILFDAVLDAGEGIADTALQGLERRLANHRVEVLPYFVAALADLRSAVSAASAQLMVKVGGEAAVPALVPLLASDDPRPRRAAFDILDQIKRSAVAPIIDGLRNPKAKSRELVNRLLGGLGEMEPAERAQLAAIVADANASGDANLAFLAQRILDGLGKPVTITRIAPANVPIRRFFDRALGDDEIAGDAEVDEVLHALNDGRAFVRQNAARWLGLGAASASDVATKVLVALGPRMRDPDAVVRAVVARTLGRIGGDDAVRALVVGLADPSPTVRGAVVDALSGLGPESLAVALEGVRAADAIVVTRTFDGLKQVVARHGRPATQPLADVLRGDRDLTALGRELACVALGELGNAAEEALPALLALTRDNNEDVRAAAATAIGFIGIDDEIVLADLKRMLNDPVMHVRRQAALAAARITGRPLDDRSPSEARVVPIAGFEDEVLGRDALRHGAANAGLDLLIAALRDGRPVVRQNAARAIGVLVDEGADVKAAAQPLGLLLRDGEVDVRKAAIAALGELGKDAIGAVWMLTSALVDPDDDVREAVIVTLVALYPECEPYLIEALRIDTTSANKGIFVVFYRLSGAAVSTLVAGLNDASGLIRLNAARALELLAKHGAANAIGDLEARLSDPIGNVRAAAQAALDAIGGKPRPPIVIEPDPIDVPGFYERIVDDAVLEAKRDVATPERLARQMRDGRAQVRANAATMVAFFDASDELTAVLPGLTVLARDSADEVKAHALAAIGKLVASGAASIETYGDVLVQALADRALVVRQAARTALEALGERAFPAMALGLAHGDSHLLDELTSLFQQAQRPAVAYIVEGLRNPKSRGRELACVALGGLGATADEALPALLAVTRDEDEEVRAAAAMAIGSIGVCNETVLADLNRMSRDSVTPVRRQAALAIARLTGRTLDDRGASEALVVPIVGFADAALDREALRAGAAEAGLDLLVASLRDGRAVVRQNAARAIGVLAEAGSVAAAARPLGMLLRDGEVDVRKAAIAALGELGKDAIGAIWQLCAGLVDADDDVREAVIATLVALHPECEADLIEALRVDTASARQGIFVVFYRLAGAGVPALVAGLKSPSGLIRLNAARALELLAKHGASNAMVELEARLADPIGAVRVAAQAALDAIGGRPRPPIVMEPDPIDVPGFYTRIVEDAELEARREVATPERLARQMRDGRPYVRANAASMVACFDASDELTAVLPGLAVLARDSANEVRAHALSALGRLIAKGAANIETYGAVLAQALADRSAFVRRAAKGALEGLGEQGFPALALGLAHTDARLLAELSSLFLALGEPALVALPDALSPLTPELHFGALTVLRAFDREALQATRPNVEPLVLSSEDPDVRAAATALLDKIDGKDLIPAAAEEQPLPLPDFDTTLMSREALAEHAADLRFDLLAHAMTDGRDIVRANATTAIEVIGTHELAWPYIVRALRDPTIEVRVRAAEALGQMPPRRDVAFELVRRLDDPSPRVIAAAEAALKAYGEFALDAFMYALDDRPELVGRSILPMIAGLGAKAVDKLVLAQRYDSPLVRLNALLCVRLLDRDLAKQARLAVAMARKDEAREVRLEALRLLDWIDGIEHIFLREPRTLPTPDFADLPIAPDILRAAARGYDAGVLSELLFDGRRMVRQNAAAAHGLIGRYHAWLGILLKDSVSAVQLAAAKSLFELGDKALHSARALIGGMLEDDPEVRQYSKDALLGLGPAALPVLIEGLWAPGDIARKTVVPIIEPLGAAATPTIIAALDHPSQLVVLNALQVLGRLYATDPKGAVLGIPKVTALIRNPLPAIIGAAQKCLFRLEGRTPAEFQKDPVPMPILGFDKGPLSVDVLRAEAPALDVAWMISAFSDGRPIVRENAARAAGFMPNATKDFLGPLTIALKDPIPEVQVAAADAFASLQSEAATAIPALTFALKNATERVKRACMVALDAYGPERVAAELVKHLVGREDWMLVTIGRVAARMSEVLVPALGHFAKRPDESLIARENAVRVLADLGQKARAAEPILLSLLPEMEGMLACKAAFALGSVARPSKDLIDAMLARLAVDPRPSLHGEVRSAVKILKRRMPVGVSA